MFKTESLQEHFDKCDWYKPSIAPGTFDESILNEYENANIKLILGREKELESSSKTSEGNKSEKDQILDKIKGVWSVGGGTGGGFLNIKIFNGNTVESFDVPYDGGSFDYIDYSGYSNYSTNKITEVVRLTREKTGDPNVSGYEIILDSGASYWLKDSEPGYLEAHSADGGYYMSSGLEKTDESVGTVHKKMGI